MQHEPLLLPPRLQQPPQQRRRRRHSVQQSTYLGVGPTPVGHRSGDCQKLPLRSSPSEPPSYWIASVCFALALQRRQGLLAVHGPMPLDIVACGARARRLGDTRAHL